MHPLQEFRVLAAPTTHARRANKRATAALDAAARARLAVLPTSVESSSGSEHEADAALSNLVNEYLFRTDATVPAGALAADDQNSDGDGDGDSDGTGRASTHCHWATKAKAVLDEIRGILLPDSADDEPLRRCSRLVADVMDSIEGLADLRTNRSAFRRAVMSRLRERGHDAGLCKARWDKSSAMAAGSHEYIDIIVVAPSSSASSSAAYTDTTTRFIVDVAFAAEFEVARPTAEFDTARAVLPEVLVARADNARRLVRAVAAAARASLKSRGLSVPRWRKRGFMMAKWFGPYRRTVNVVPASVGAAIAGSGAAAVCCTVLGFGPPSSIPTISRGF